MSFLCCIVLSAVLAAGAAEPPSGPIDLFGAIRIALAHNPDLERAQAQVRQAEARLLEARSRFYPTVSLETELLAADAPSSYLFKKIDQRRLRPNTNFNHPGQLENSEVGVGLFYNLYSGGRDVRSKRIGELDVSVSGNQQQTVENRLIHAVIEAYFDTLAAIELIRAAGQSVETVKEQLRETQIRFQGGSALRSDVLSLEVRLAEAEEEVIRSENARDLALVLLANLMGLGDWQGLQLSGKEWHPRPIPDSAQEALPNAFQDRPEAAAARTMVERSQLEVSQARSEYLPRVDTFARLYADDNRFSYRADDANWTIGVALGWDLYSGPRRKAHRHLAEAGVDEMMAMDRQTKQQILLDVNRAYLNLKAATTRHEVTQASVTQAEESLRLVKRQFEGGAATVTRYLDAEGDLTAARVREIAARYDVKKAQADVGRALGWCSLCAREALQAGGK